MKSDQLQVRASQAAKDWFLATVAEQMSPAGAFAMVSAIRCYSTSDAMNCKALAIIRRDNGQDAFDHLLQKARGENSMSDQETDEGQSFAKYCPKCWIAYPEAYQYCPICSQELDPNPVAVKVCINMEDCGLYVFGTSLTSCPVCGSKPLKEIQLSAEQTRLKAVWTLRELIRCRYSYAESPEMTRETMLHDLRLDSLTILELLEDLQVQYGMKEIPEEEVDKMKRVGDVEDYVLASMGEKSRALRLAPDPA